MHRNQSDPEYPDENGERLDGRDLIQEWLEKHPNSQYVWNKNQFDQIDVEKVDHVMGTYCPYHHIPNHILCTRIKVEHRYASGVVFSLTRLQK